MKSLYRQKRRETFMKFKKKIINKDALKKVRNVIKKKTTVLKPKKKISIQKS